MVDTAGLPNVVIIVLDTLRHDFALEIPEFRKLAERGLHFTKLWGSSTFTYPNLCSLRSGLYPPRHGWRTWPTGGPFSAPVTLEECLAQAGYTIATTMDVPPENETRDIKRPKSQPFFRFCWFTGIHDRVFKKSMPVNGVSHDRYRACLAGVNGYLRQAVDLFDDCLLVVLGDHGVGLDGDRLRGEGFDVGAGQVYDFRTRIPCAIAGPDIQPATVADAHSIADLMPTILDLLGLSIPEGVDGQAVGQRSKPVYMEAQSPHSIWPSEWPNVFGATDGSVKVMLTPDGLRCYDLDDDPGETVNRADLIDRDMVRFIGETRWRRPSG